MKAVKLRKTGRWMAVACAMVAASFSAGTVFASDLQNCYLSSVQVQSTTLRERILTRPLTNPRYRAPPPCFAWLFVR